MFGRAFVCIRICWEHDMQRCRVTLRLAGEKVSRHNDTVPVEVLPVAGCAPEADAYYRLLSKRTDRPCCSLLPSSRHAVEPWLTDVVLLTLTWRRLQLEDSEDWVDHVDDIVTRFEEETGRRPLYSIMFY